MNAISNSTAPPPASAPDTRPAAPPVATPATPAASPPPKPVATGSTAPAVAPRPDAATTQKISEELQRKVDGVTAELQFSVDESSGRSVIKVTDRATSDVIRQIPTEEALQISEALDQYQKGLLVNRKE
jgi:flagellar protein FlaG